MAKEENIISLDIGSNSVHGIIAHYDDNLNKIDILAAKTVPAPTGIKDGVNTYFLP
jgi:cell division ATPase FtsA